MSSTHKEPGRRPGRAGGEPETYPHLSGAGLTSALALTALLLESYMWIQLASGQAGLGRTLVSHVVLCVGLSGLALVRFRKGGDCRLVFLLATTTWAMGPFGAGGVLLVSALNRWYERVSKPFQEWYDALFPEDEETFTERVYERVKRMMEANDDSTGPPPFADLLSFGSLAEKQAVIATVSKHFRPAFAPILRMALQDSTNAVRVQAATAISVLETRFSERIQELSEEVESAADDEARATPLLELAKWYDDYAFTGLLDREREANNRTRAFQTYQRYLALRPDDDTVRLAAGRVLLRDGQYDKAAAFLATSFPDGFPSAKSALWYMESLFHVGRFTELRDVANRHASEIVAEGESFPKAACDAVGLWSHGPIRDPNVDTKASAGGAP